MNSRTLPYPIQPAILHRSALLTALLMAASLALQGIPAAHAADASAAPPSAPGGESSSQEIPYSKAETLLFLTDHLKPLPPHVSQLHYHFAKAGSYEAPYEDKVTVEVGAPDAKADNGRPVTMEFLSGEHKLDLPPVPGAKGNPVILGFLERDVREMKRIASGNPNYYRKSIRLALVDVKEKDIKEGSTRWGGKDIHTEEITIDPYRNDPARSRFARFANKTFTFLLSDQVPGGVVSMKTVMHEGSISGRTMIEETLTLTESK